MKVKFSVGLFLKREAFFSDCRQYRYYLKIIWNPALPVAAFIGLNPSTADEHVDDNTVRRCRGFAEEWGCGGIIMLNIFAYRSTDPKGMKAHHSPIGPDNTIRMLQDCLSQCHGPHIAAWGRHGKHMNRGEIVAKEIGKLWCLEKNSDGTPAHPLYLKADLKPIPYNFIQ